VLRRALRIDLLVLTYACTRCYVTLCDGLTGGVGWGKGRLHGAEAQQMAELLLQVKEMLADELV
jgi:hypothetical protein